jgi:hypothetical protein
VPCSGSLVIRHVYLAGCRTAFTFWGSQIVTSSLPWLVPTTLISGLQFSQLLLPQALAVAAMVGTVGIRCGQAESTCESTGERYQDAAELLTAFSNPFLPLTSLARLGPRASCRAVLAFSQIAVGYFFVLAGRRRVEVAKRLQYARQRGWALACQQLERVQKEGWPAGLAGCLISALLWHVVLLVLADR